MTYLWYAQQTLSLETQYSAYPTTGDELMPFTKIIKISMSKIHCDLETKLEQMH